MTVPRYLFSTFLILAAGCALSPQVIPIHPDIRIDNPSTNKGTLALEVVDLRNSKILGKRGGVYKETSDISTAADITGSLRQSLAKALSKMGYEVTTGHPMPGLRVEVTSLSYRVIDDKVTRHIETRAVVNAIYKKGNKTFTNTYTVTRKKEMLTAPDEAENETLINDTLAAALQQMLEDGELFTLINSSF